MLKNTPFILAIDGPAASGKGTLAKRLAEYFGLRYLDTGRLYRAVGWQVVQRGYSVEDSEAAVQVAKTITWQDTQNTHLYDEKIGHYASVVSAIPAVREALLAFQREFAYDTRPGAVLDGRDIGTVICPDATIKIFVTATLDARAKRRFKELNDRDIKIDFETIRYDLERRDARDQNRTIAPLVAAPDAVHLDTTDLTADEAFEQAASLVKPYIQ